MAAGFYQRRGELINAILNSTGLTPAQKCIGVKLLAGYMNNEHESAWMSVATLSTHLKFRPETTRRSLARLVALNFLTRERRAGRTTIYWMGDSWRAARIGPYSPKPGTSGAYHPGP